MMDIRRADERGRTNWAWLDSRHTFSFGEYYDPENMGFRALRVINEDLIAPRGGFPMHPHRDMEIITYVVSGEVAHRDSHGHESVVRAGEVQRMSAGGGVFHSEYNPSREKPLHLLQVWILPERGGGPFSYEQRSLAEALRTNKLVLAASRSGREGSISIQQDVDLWASRPKGGDEFAFELRPGRHVWLQLVSGRLRVNSREVSAGDALYGEEAGRLQITALEDADFLLFDLA